MTRVPDINAQTLLRLSLLLALSLGAGTVRADEQGATVLARLLRPLDSLHATFSQHLFDGQGRMLRTSDGELWAARPDRFRWETSAPFAEVLVGDGATVWLFDPDLEQVTVRPFDERLRGTPARILSGNVDTMLDGFDVDLINATDMSYVFALRPRGDDALFERLELVFLGGLPNTMTIHDQLGQRTEVVLADVSMDEAPDAARFTFEIPEGIDVIDDRGDADMPDDG